jgi:hypothetical protein
MWTKLCWKLWEDKPFCVDRSECISTFSSKYRLPQYLSAFHESCGSVKGPSGPLPAAETACDLDRDLCTNPSYPFCMYG